MSSYDQCECCKACMAPELGFKHEHDGRIECGGGLFLCQDCAFYATQDGIVDDEDLNNF